MDKKKVLGAVMGEALSDAETIAKSALGLAINRSQDLDHNPIITIVMLAALCEVAIEDYASKDRVGVAGMSTEEGMKILRDMIEKAIKEQWEEHKVT